MKQDLVVLYGTGRSGTSWLHLLLGAHPEIVTGQQSRVFSRYLLPIYEGWKRELQAAKSEGRIHGISSYITEDTLIESIQIFAERIFSTLENMKQDASLLLENQPGDTASLELISRCFPKVRFIHMVRDGRDVTVSMLRGYAGWQVNSVKNASTYWRDRIHDGWKGRVLGAGYHEVKYEDLQEQGPARLQEVFRFLGVNSDAKIAESIYNEYRFENVSARKHKSPFFNPGIVKASGTKDRTEPKGFFRVGTSGYWRDTMSRRDLSIFNAIAGDTLREAGYILQNPTALPAGRRSIESLKHRFVLRLVSFERAFKSRVKKIMRLN